MLAQAQTQRAEVSAVAKAQVPARAQAQRVGVQVLAEVQVLAWAQRAGVRALERVWAKAWMRALVRRVKARVRTRAQRAQAQARVRVRARARVWTPALAVAPKRMHSRAALQAGVALTTGRGQWVISIVRIAAMSEAHALPCMHCQPLPDGSHS